MISFYRKYWRTAFDIALIILTVYLFMLLFSYLYRIATPIFLAVIIFFMIEPLARFLNRRGMRKSLASAISTFLFIIVILGALVGAGIIFTNQILNLVDIIRKYSSQTLFQEQLMERFSVIQGQLQNLIPPEC